MRRSTHLLLAGSLLALTPALAPAAQGEPGRPNLVLVMTDDQGYGDFGCTGNPVLDTPHLDALAASSPAVERFYVSPVCSPTRACLMTGRYNYRTRVVDTWIGRSNLEPEEVTLAEALRAGGYRTGIFGKWHLGDCHPMRPIDQGFDESLVHRGGGLAQPSEPPENGRRYTDAILFRNGERVETKGYCTDVYFDAALAFVDESLEREQPFFAYVATNAPHDPFHDVPEELHAKYSERDLTPVLRGDRPDADRVARIFAMIENVDQNVGRLLTHLTERGIERDTVVVFLVDNGPIGGRYVAGLRGGKTGVHEGGIRSPLFVRWPGRLSPDTVVRPITAHLDLFPTLLEMAGVTPPEGVALDGRSLLPLLEGRPVEWEDRHLVLQSHRGNVPVAEHHCAVIGPRWKLVRPSGFGRERPGADSPFELYDLVHDPGERTDLAAAHPERVAAMRAVYARWFADVSATRADNWAPPRIVVGTRAEPITTLTRQDWREPAGGGWGANGAWPLRVPEARGFDLELLFREARRFDRVRVHAGEVVIDVAPDSGGTRLDLGRIELPAGDVDLRIDCHAGDEVSGPYQVVLRTRF